jgi:hypothetical protein
MLCANPPFESKYPIIDNISLSYNLVEHMLPKFHNCFLLPKWIMKNKIIIWHPNVELEKVLQYMIFKNEKKLINLYFSIIYTPNNFTFMCKIRQTGLCPF